MESVAQAGPLMDVEAFRREGYVVVRGLVGARTLKSLATAIQDLLRAGRTFTEDTVLRGTRYQVQSASGRPADGALAPGTFRKITFPSCSHRALARFCGDERIGARIEALGVASPRCVVDQINLKAPRVGTRFPWHHDAAFVGWRDQEAIARGGGVNVVVAVDAADADNGAFEVLAGSHLDGPREFDYDLGASDDGAIDTSRRTLLPMSPGDAVFFHPYLLHGSGPNSSDRSRRMVALWFVSAG